MKTNIKRWKIETNVYFVVIEMVKNQFLCKDFVILLSQIRLPHLWYSAT